MNFFVGAILPYFTVIIFFAAFIYQIYKWKKHPSPPMTLFPAPEKHTNRVIELLKETFLFKRLFYGDRFLWLISWIFHISLLLIFISHYANILAFMVLTNDSILKISFLPQGL